MSSDVAGLNARFAVPGRVEFAQDPGGLTVARIANDQAEAVVSLSGGHVMSWQPRGERPVLWLSGHAKFAPGKSIRGGVPVCWPWFGPHGSDPGLPAHGFARTAPWAVERTESLPAGGTRLVLALRQPEAARAWWPHACSLECRIEAGRELRIELATRNLGDRAFAIGEALHTYFAVSDVRRTKILGLDGCGYIDKVDGGRRKRQSGPVVIAEEVDRVYLSTEAECAIDDPGFGRRIRIRKSGSRSTVVWNPWVAKAEKMGDFGPEGHLGMVCVESGNAADDVVAVAPGAEHVLAVVYSVEPAA